jgi:hypothetical protein
VLVGTPEQLRAYQEAGFRFLGCNSDGGLLATSATRLAGELQDLKQRESVSVESP